MRLIAAILLLLLASPSQAVTRYISPATGSPAGDDARTCLQSQTASTPKRNFHGASGAIACMSPGDTLILRGGTYPKGIDRDSAPNIASGGGEGSRTIITVQPGETATIQPVDGSDYGGIEFTNASTNSYITFDGGTNCGANSEGAACRLILDLVNQATSGVGAEGIKLGGASHVRVTNFEVKNAGNNGISIGPGAFPEILNGNIHHNGAQGQAGSHGYAIYYGSGDDGVIANNRIYNSGGFGIHINACNVNMGSTDCNGEDHTIHRAVIRFNDIYANGQLSTQETAGMLIGGFTEDLLAYGNIVHDNVNNAGGIMHNYFRPTVRARVINNTVTRNARWGIQVYNAQNSQQINNLVGDNDRANSGFPNIDIAYPGTDNTYTTNGCFGTGGTGGGCNLTVTPSFVNATGANFRLSAGSGAIDAGTVLSAPYNSAPYNVDIAGVPRPTGGGYDLGAYEYGVTVTPPAPQLVLALPLDEGTGTLASDVSGQKNNASFVGGVTWDNTGVYGKAVSLDGTGYLNIPAAASLALAPAMTLEAWIYPTATFAGFATVIRQDRYFLYAASDAGYCNSPNLAPLGGYSTTVINYICATSAPPPTSWSHLAITMDGLTMTFYLNGNIIATQTSTDPMVPTSYPMTIGASAFGEYFIGKIDQPMVYNYARTQPQIKSDMSTPLIGGPGKYVEIAAPASVEISASASLEISAD